MKKIFSVLILAGVIGSIPAGAQHFLSLQYSMGFGSGNTKSFVNSPSFRGVSIDYRNYVDPNIGVGFEAGWNVFYERRAYDTYTSGTASISGVQYRYVNSVPLLLAADYYFSPGEHINPFVGLGVGTLYSATNTDMNIYTLKNESWQFALRPEAGILVNANPDLDIILVGKYYGGFETNALVAQSYFTFNIGFVFKSE